MRVLVVNNLYPPMAFGGYEVLCQQIVETLQSRGYEIDVLTSDFRAAECPPAPRVHRLLQLTTDFPRPGEDVGFVDFRLRRMHAVARVNQEHTERLLREKPYDLVFCWCLNRMSIGPVLAARDVGVPVCYTVNDEHPKQFRPAQGAGLRGRARVLAERSLWSKATLRDVAAFPTTVISQALKDSLLDQGTPIEHARVIHQGIPLEQFPFAPTDRRPGEALRVLYVGQLSASKGVHTVIRALASVDTSHPDDMQLTIVGSGVPEYERYLRGLVDEFGLGDRVSFTGRVPHEEVASMYRRSHVLAFSSECREAFGLSHLEAMASGCAVVSTLRGGCAELVRDGRNALEFEAGNALHLAAKLDELRRDEHARRALVRAGRQWVERHHSLSGYCSNLEEFMSDACELRALN